jgi:hypothetical protein
LQFQTVCNAIREFPPAVDHGLAALGAGLESFNQRSRFLGVIDLRRKRSPRPAAESASEGVPDQRPARVCEKSIECRGDFVVFAVIGPDDRAFQPLELPAARASGTSLR